MKSTVDKVNYLNTLYIYIYICIVFHISVRFCIFMSSSYEIFFHIIKRNFAFLVGYSCNKSLTVSELAAYASSAGKDAKQFTYHTS